MSSNNNNNNPDVNDALNEFYKLKSTYETEYYIKYVKPIISSKVMSKREKKAAYSKLPKAECINCKRNVGTLFSIKKDVDEYIRIFTAKCGDIEAPCPLDINIEYADRLTFVRQMEINDNDLNELKTQIIKDKNDLMFGYIEQNEAVFKFNGNTDELKELTEIAGYVINTNIVTNENPEKKVLTKNLEDEFGISYLIPFKNMMKEYDESNGRDKKKVNEAVTFYVNEMIPKIREIQKLKYESEFIDCEPNVSGDKYFLFQRKNSLVNLEMNFFSKDTVKSFVKGVLESRQPAQKTSKTKTRKIRPKIQLVEEVVQEPGPNVEEPGPNIEEPGPNVEEERVASENV